MCYDIAGLSFVKYKKSQLDDADLDVKDFYLEKFCTRLASWKT
jgi:hypothetical protein